MSRSKVIIMGAAGRDFHNFNMFYRDQPDYEVVAFTATQIPEIEERRYPSELAGSLYPTGIPILHETNLPDLVEEHGVAEVVFAYSDVSHEYVMHRASIALAAGADFRLIGPDRTMLNAKVPVVAVCAVRTGSGKSQTSRRVADYLRERGLNTVIIRHPMPYGDLAEQACQRFETFEDLDRHNCTIEEREDYEASLERGFIVYAGVDYEMILSEAEQEADVLVWDGGNNDLPFLAPDRHIVVVDPHRPGHELQYHPGEANFRMADVLVINKVNTAKEEAIEKVRENIRQANPDATVIEAASEITVAEPDLIRGKRVLVVEDGPTTTHGGMTYGAGYLAAQQWEAAEIVDPRPYAVGSIRETFDEYPDLKNILPAVGYGGEQRRELEETINNVPCDAVVVATPIDLTRFLALEVPTVRVRYELAERKGSLSDVLEEWLAEEGL